ncbi:sensor histidine kinase [Paucilactobacillus kaifaensis]|uniref:sensor histidine kinase n=1 Tax=Paucilactobacillus kaifaensis TaxID=2559921 RepID=UPI0010F8E396|nr:ATP-binding protein [Paucilactobacillus kaifaensis]
MKKQIILFFVINLVLFELVSFLLPFETGPKMVSMFVLALITTVIFGMFMRWLVRKTNLVSEKVQQITDEQDEVHLLVSPQDPLFDLVQEINRLQSHIRHQTHQNLRQENELETLIKNLPVGVLVIDRFGQIQIANTAVQKLLQRNLSKLPHSYLEDIVQPDLLMMVNQAMQQQKSQQKLVTFPMGQTKKNIRVQVLHSEIRPRHFQVLVLLTDVSDLVAMTKMQADFVANASHELKTPITAINGFSETLLDQDLDMQTQHQFLTIIKQESNKLVKLIDDVLSLSRLRNGQQDNLELESVHPAELVDQQINNLQALAKLDQVELQNNINNELVVVSDQNRLSAILYNLIANAIKYTQKSGSVVIDANQDGNRWSLSITDNGIGIPIEEQSRIFERFYRGKNGITRSGTGLGLAIVAEQVHQLSGQVSVDSKTGFGTTMKVEFDTTSVKK